MQRNRVLFRLAALAALSALSAPALPSLAVAQGAGILPDAGDTGPEVNPPALVGALVGIEGAVSFHAPGADEWDTAVLNYPITAGEGLWTQPGGQARISIGDAVLEMASSTEFEVQALDATGLVATLPQGEVYLHVRSLFPGQTLTIVTPRGSVTISAPGRYDLVSGTTDEPTAVSVVEGAAILGEGGSGAIPAGAMATITGSQAPFEVQTGPLQQTAFLAEMLRREQPRAGVAPPPALVADMPGGEELGGYGTWSDTPTYGEVWYPQVASGWVPYREGHWAYVAPWGWTWVDDEPWGFAPFHYGRWAEIDGRWGWVPGRERDVPDAPAYPVYAPALVSFFGVGAAVGVTAAVLGSGHVGWVPLGPGEVYRPWFHAAPRYVREVNVRHVTNVTEINTVINNRTVNRMTVNEFRNARAATVVPAAAMATSQPVRPLARPADPQALREAHPVIGHQPVPPTTAALGVSPAVARAVHAVPPPAGVTVPRRPAAPGPAIRAAVTAASRIAPDERQHRGGAEPALVRPVPSLRPPGAAPPAHPSAGTAPREANRAIPPATPAPALVPQRHEPPSTIPHPSAPAIPHPQPPHVARPQPPAAVAPRIAPPAAPALVPQHHESPSTIPHPSAPAIPHPQPPHAARPQPPAAVAPRIVAPIARPAPRVEHPAPPVHAPAVHPPVPVVRPAPPPAVHAQPPRPAFHPPPAPAARAPAAAPHPAPPPHGAPPERGKRPGEH